MTTVSNAIITWLKTFNPADYGKMKSIETDILPAKAESYSLAKEPIINKRTSISGKVTATEHYTLMARLTSQTPSDRRENVEWGELLEEWVTDQNRSGNFPAIHGAVVRSVSVTTPFCIGNVAGTSDSVYQLTISIKYEKENLQ